MIYFFCGQPGSGKTTLAKALIENNQEPCIHIDGDEVREITKNFDYSDDGRKRNVQFIMDLCRFLDHKGFTVVVSMVAPFRKMRNELKSTNNVTEIYVHTDEIRGREEFFVKNFEEPDGEHIKIDTTNKTIEECLLLIPFNQKQYGKVGS
jgi:adenylylsulfate kinase-like enzyme